jgi:NADPH2:quinone reductase
MRSAQFSEHGDSGVLEIVETDAPDPGPEEVLVDVHAASINPHDIELREGHVPVSSFPHTPGLDCAGTVSAIGSEVTAFELGERIFGIGEDADGPGGCAEQAVLPTSAIAPLPETCDFETGAAAALVGTTAWRALFQKGELTPTAHAVLHSGSGGVGHMAVQLAAAAGADVTTTAAPDYHKLLTELGAAATFDYNRSDLGDAIETRGPAEFVLDTRADEYFELDGQIAGPGATIVAVGTEEPTAAIPVAMGLGKEFAYEPMSVYGAPDKAEVLGRLTSLMVEGHLEPVVAETFALDELPAAQRYLTEESFFGKVVVTL